jgi:two-component system secretion response regulator SsrB
MRQRPTILVADDHPIVAEALFTSLKRWFKVIGTVTDLDELETTIEDTHPRIVLLDLSFGKRSSLSVLPGLVLQFPKTRFIILTAHPDPVLADAAMLAGARAFVLKQSASSELRIAIQEVLAGKKYLTPTLKLGGAGGNAVPIDDDRIALSERQREILGLLRAGHPYRVVADKLGVSSKTVEYHVDSLTRRIGVRGKAQLIRWSERFFQD